MGIESLVEKFDNFYREYATTKSDFANLKERTKETLAEFKSTLELMSEKLNKIELQHITSQSDLKAKYDVLNERINTVAQNAIITVMQDMAKNGRVTLEDSKKDFDKLINGD